MHKIFLITLLLALTLLSTALAQPDSIWGDDDADILAPGRRSRPRPRSGLRPRPRPGLRRRRKYMMLSPARQERLMRKMQAAGGCNANVCFAIDGSTSISSDEFTNEKNFVLDVVSVLVDNPVEFAAVQYADRRERISKLTVDDEAFILKVNSTKQMYNPRSLIKSGVNFCFRQLMKRPGEPMKMVILGDARVKNRRVARRTILTTDQFRANGGDVSVVAAGAKINKQLMLKLTGGNEELVYDVDNFLDVLTLEIYIERVVEEICSM